MLCAQEAAADEAAPLPPAHITIEYGTNDGLFNQQVATVNALLLAAGLRATVFRWTPSQDRSTFAKSPKLQKWHWVPVPDVYDMPTAQEYFAGASPPRRANPYGCLASESSIHLCYLAS